KKLTDAYIEALAPYTTNKTTTCTSNSIPVFGTKLGSFLNNTITSDYFWVNHCTKSTLTSPNYSGLSSYFELRKNGNFFLNMDYNRGEDFLLSNGSKVRTYKYWRAPIYEKTNTGQLPKARNTIFAPGHSIIYDSVYESNGLRYSFRTALPMNIEETQEFLTDKRKFEDWILRVEVGFNQFLNTNSATIAPKECAAAQAPVSSALPATNTSISNSENEPSEGLEAD
ncbi:MAG TPA: hypothetical protein PLH57_10925, partial [Oligoflexia bacterium]|nr:hypothetical protein [Oligoflexia bacterium]